jgi:endonuclease/exonuclease/phosphatase family metal-dependent hydrolase
LLDEFGQAPAARDQVHAAENLWAKFALPRRRGIQGGVRRARILFGVVALLWGTATLGRGRAKPDQAPALAGAFSSSESCRELLRAGQRLARPPGTARFASWNLHWFPDGSPSADGASDLSWLACTLAWLDADVVAVQEVKQTPAAERALAELLAELNRLSGARYVVRLDDCGKRVQQHVGLLWNEARVASRSVQTIGALNPAGSACQDQLRPGLAAHLRFPGGLDLTAISAHFKSKGDERAFALRGRSFAALPGVVTELARQTRDADVLLLGDLNTMGCDECTPRVSALDEQRAVRSQLARGQLSLVPADAQASLIYAGRAALLDHVVAPSNMRELPQNARSHVAGSCAAGASKLRGRAAERARRALSDHCPLVLDLSDRDLD